MSDQHTLLFPCYILDETLPFRYWFLSDQSRLTTMMRIFYLKRKNRIFCEYKIKCPWNYQRIGRNLYVHKIEKEMLFIMIHNIKLFHVMNSHFTFHRDILEQLQHLGQQKCKLIDMVFSWSFLILWLTGRFSYGIAHQPPSLICPSHNWQCLCLLVLWYQHFVSLIAFFCLEIFTLVFIRCYYHI